MNHDEQGDAGLIREARQLLHAFGECTNDDQLIKRLADALERANDARKLLGDSLKIANDTTQRAQLALAAAESALRASEDRAGRLEARSWSYVKQPTDNVDCWRIGEACSKAASDPKCGDYIDRGLILLKELQAKGYGIAALSAAPPERGKPNPAWLIEGLDVLHTWWKLDAGSVWTGAWVDDANNATRFATKWAALEVAERAIKKGHYLITEHQWAETADRQSAAWNTCEHGVVLSRDECEQCDSAAPPQEKL